MNLLKISFSFFSTFEVRNFKKMQKKYDVIVVGGGHAGCEAASSSANLGMQTLLVTMDMTKFGEMSCNPAMGGVAKGQIVREIDAIGGYSGIVTDKTTIQFRMLNMSKGPAMWSPRAQCDRRLFALHWREMLENTKNLDLWQDIVEDIIIENGSVKGVKTKLQVQFLSDAVILTTGTFQNGKIHVGKVNFEGGRASEESTKFIADKFRNEFGFKVERLKTGTSARVDGRTINFKVLEEQKSDEGEYKFSYLPNTIGIKDRKSCYITHTNEMVHDILREAFKDSPLFNGTIQGVGPRYCPSIEDKIVRFAEKNKHQLFLEPEGSNTCEYYINGFSSSLPLETQIMAINKIQGMENAKIFRPGYAIEYDYYDPTQLYHTLETRIIKNLYFAGQINGTTGYEEAGAQGLMAGINAALNLQGKEPFILDRNEAYIGVLIDDLINKGVDEPYRMFTSRAEYRILLRQDNADERLTEMAYKIGLASEQRMKLINDKTRYKSTIIDMLKKTSVPNNDPDKTKIKLFDLLKRPEEKLKTIIENNENIKKELSDAGNLIDEIIENTEISVKYSSYIEKEKQTADKLIRLENIKLHEDFNYDSLKSLTIEARQKLKKYKPKSIKEASRISGISPSDINSLLIYFGR